MTAVNQPHFCFITNDDNDVNNWKLVNISL